MYASYAWGSQAWSYNRLPSNLKCLQKPPFHGEFRHRESSLLDLRVLFIGTARKNLLVEEAFYWNMQPSSCLNVPFGGLRSRCFHATHTSAHLAHETSYLRTNSFKSNTVCSCVEFDAVKRYFCCSRSTTQIFCLQAMLKTDFVRYSKFRLIRACSLLITRPRSDTERTSSSSDVIFTEYL